MHKLLGILLGAGIPTVILITVFKSFFSKVFRFIAAVIWVALIFGVIAKFCHWITFKELINVFLILWLPLKAINKLTI